MHELIIRFLFGPELDGVALAFWQFVIPALVGAAGLWQSKKQGDRASQLGGEQVALAREQAEIARKLFEQASPIRDQATDLLLERLRQGRRAMPDLTGLVDSANPFRSQFRMPVPPPPPQSPGTGGSGSGTGAPPVLPPVPTPPARTGERRRDPVIHRPPQFREVV